MAQHEFFKNPRSLHDKIVNIELEESVFSPSTKPENLEQYWKSVFETDSVNDHRPFEVKASSEIDYRISVEGVTRELNTFDKGTAPGPDGVKVCDLKAIPISGILIVLNSCLIATKVPTQWKGGRTTLIPKLQGAKKPDQ